MKNLAPKDSDYKVGRILVVDDEAELLSALCESLIGQGYEVAGFLTGDEALSVLKDKEFDLLLTDLMMPGMDGIALIRAGIEIDPNLIGIIMTGHGTVQTAVEAMKTGAFDYILKPFKLNTLLPLLSRAMQVRNLRLENMQLKETVAIHELGKAIAFSSDLNSILNKVADAALQQCNADEASIMLPTKSGRELYVAVVRGGRTENLGEKAPIEQGIAGWVARNRESVVLKGEVDDPRMAPIKPRNDIRIAVSMPLLSQSKLVGVLNVNITKSHRQFTLGQLKALSILVSIIAPVLENTSLYIQILKAEEEYRSIFENACEGIFRSLPGERFITANPALAQIFGYDSPEDILASVTNITRQIYVNPDDAGKLSRIMETQGAIINFECQAYCKNGSLIWISVSAHAVRDEKGVLLYHEGTMEDITQRKRLDARLKLAKEILETLNSQNNIEKLIEDILRLLKEHTGFEAIGIRLKEGEDYPYFVSDGFPAHFLEVENQLCAFNDAGEIIRDPLGNVVLECMCGNILSGRTDASLPFFTKNGSFWTNSTTQLLASTTEEERQARTRNRCNREGYESVTLIPLRSGEEVIGLLQMNDSRKNIFTLDRVAFFEGIAASIGISIARKKVGEALRKSLHQLQNTRDMLIQSDKLAAIGTLAAGVTHEILNPLNIISVYFQMLSENEIPSEKLRQTFEICLQQVERIVKISKDLNQFARQESRDILLGNINDLIEQTFNLITPKLRVNKVATDLQLRSDLPSIPLDKNRLGQVFLNLVNNAVDAMEASPAKVLRVTTALVTAAEREMVRVVFADRGTGIPEESILKIFDPFFTTKEPGKGTGLGLSVAYSIIQDHGGNIRAENNEWGGASFIIELPVHSPSESTSSQGSSS